ncbi:MAG: SDR family oxidoreductase [Deltaproteobacteria bacterium]|nr:SDR family oxidoreductase [Deltaproteobacteria bacterium]
MDKVNFSLNGKIALVTGASRGIGRAIATTLADYGAQVIIVSRKADALEAAAEQISSRGGKADAMVCNVGDIKQIEHLCSSVAEKYGKLNILVNNAATNPYFGDMLGANESLWNKTFDVNLKGPFFLIQAAAKLMMHAGGGAIVNVSSINGVRPAPLQGMYSITKAAVICMTQAFAKELAPMKIRVNAILPGLVNTDFSKVIMSNDQIYQYAINMIPMRRHSEPMEIAGAVLYLVSDAAPFTTGACLVVDGGALA